MTTAPMARLNESAPTAPSARPVEASTKLNSPLWPTSAPARSADDGRCPSNRASAAMGMALPSVTMRSSATTTGMAARIAAGWRRIPIETKKKVANSSRSGTISPSTLSVRSESASASPATKAPRATLTPSALAAKAVPIAMTATPITNSSRDRRPAIIASSRGSSREPATTSKVTKPSATAPRTMTGSRPFVLARAEGGQRHHQHDRQQVLDDRDAERGEPVRRWCAARPRRRS